MNIKEIIVGGIFAFVLLMTILNEVLENFTIEFWHIALVLILFFVYRFYQLYKDS